MTTAVKTVAASETVAVAGEGVAGEEVDKWKLLIGLFLEVFSEVSWGLQELLWELPVVVIMDVVIQRCQLSGKIIWKERGRVLHLRKNLTTLPTTSGVSSTRLSMESKNLPFFKEGTPEKSRSSQWRCRRRSPSITRLSSREKISLGVGRPMEI